MNQEILEAVIKDSWSLRPDVKGIDFNLQKDQLQDRYQLVLISESRKPDMLYDYSTHYLSLSDVANVVMREEYSRLAKLVDRFLADAVTEHRKLFEDMTPKEIPLFTEAVIGYRKWRLLDWVLAPINYGAPWRPGENTAVCQPNRARSTYGNWHEYDIPGHDKPPHENCHCGLNAFFEISDASKQQGTGSPEFVLGAVIGWGDMRVHPDGFRAEKARIVGLFGQPIEPLNEVAGIYDIPVFESWEKLQIEASEHGSPLPESLRPDEKRDVHDRYASTTFNQALKQMWSSPNVQLYNTGIFSTNPNPGGYAQYPVSGGTLSPPTTYKKNPQRVKPYNLGDISKYGPPPSHAQRMEEMTKKIKNARTKYESQMLYFNPPAKNKKLPKWMRLH